MLECTRSIHLAFLLVEDFLPLSRAERLQLQAGLVDVQYGEAEKGVPHLTHPADINKGQ